MQVKREKWEIMTMKFINTDFLKDNELWLMLSDTSEAIPEQNIVPSYRFDIVRLSDNVTVGRCSLRVGHNERLYYGGNIGYGIDEPYRGNHYAAKSCTLLFQLAKKHDLGYVIITCNPDNLASRKTIERAGGRLLEIAELPPDNDMRAKGETHTCVFRINLD